MTSYPSLTKSFLTGIAYWLKLMTSYLTLIKSPAEDSYINRVRSLKDSHHIYYDLQYHGFREGILPGFPEEGILSIWGQVSLCPCHRAIEWQQRLKNLSVHFENACIGFSKRPRHKGNVSLLSERSWDKPNLTDKWYQNRCSDFHDRYIFKSHLTGVWQYISHYFPSKIAFGHFWKRTTVKSS